MLDSRFSPQVTQNEDNGQAIGFCWKNPAQQYQCHLLHGIVGLSSPKTNVEEDHGLGDDGQMMTRTPAAVSIQRDVQETETYRDPWCPCRRLGDLRSSDMGKDQRKARTNARCIIRWAETILARLQQYSDACLRVSFNNRYVNNLPAAGVLPFRRILKKYIVWICSCFVEKNHIFNYIFSPNFQPL